MLDVPLHDSWGDAKTEEASKEHEHETQLDTTHKGENGILFGVMKSRLFTVTVTPFGSSQPADICVGWG